MMETIGIFLLLVSVSREMLSNDHQEITNFQKFVKQSNLTQYMSRAGYTSQSYASSKASCGLLCLSGTNCSAFFYDTATLLCQLHPTVPVDILLLTSSPTADCYATESSTACPSGTFSYDNGKHCYYFDESSHSFNDAKLFCTNSGGEIVKIDEVDQHTFIADMLTQKASGNSFYIGLNELSGMYRWSDAQPTLLDYNNWGSGQPAGGTELCVVMYGPDSWMWHNTDCSNQVAVVCQK